MENNPTTNATGDGGRGEVLDHEYEAIAIVGMGCRFPGAHGLAEYWKMLQEGKPQFKSMSAADCKDKKRWNNDAIFDPDSKTPGTVLHRKFGLIDEIDRFDADFFGLSPKEAADMDPQHRILLETTYEALEDSGYTLEDLVTPNNNIGVYVGAYEGGWNLMSSTDPIDIGSFASQARPLFMVSNRISHWFGLQGPSVTLDTACSSSLSAVHLAARALQQNDCRMALACGTNLLLHPFFSFGLSRIGALSAGDALRAFDADADGFLRGEGVGTVVLKRASDAIQDGDRIYAFVRGSDISSGGKTKILTKPNPLAEAETMRRAMKRAQVDPDDVQFVEAHGTGTPVGDGIELSAIMDAFNVHERSKDKPTLRVGSVKSQIGHLETVSGMASIIKMCLCLYHGKFTPNANFRTPNKILVGQPIVVQTSVEPIEHHGTGALVGVNSFGLGGTLGHVVLEAKDTYSEWSVAAGALPRQDAAGWRLAIDSTSDGKRLVFPFSASSKKALKQTLVLWKDAVEAVSSSFGQGADKMIRSQEKHAINGSNDFLNVDAALVAHTLSAHRNHLPFRVLVDGTSAESFQSSLSKVIEDIDSLPKTALQRGMSRTNVLFVFPGQGPQCTWMGKTLYDAYPGFRASVHRVDAEFTAQTGESLIEKLQLFQRTTPDPQNPKMMENPAYCQSAIFMFQVGLVELLEAHGVYPAACLGHSAGEVAASWASGILTLREAVSVALARASCVANLNGTGGMLVVQATEAITADFVVACKKSDSWFCEVGALNSQTSTVLTGNQESLQAVKTAADNANVRAIFMRTTTPYHSSLIEANKIYLLQMLGKLNPKAGEERPLRTMFSSSMGRKLDLAVDVCDKDFWWKNVRQTVQFHRALRNLWLESSSDQGLTLNYVVEIANHPVLGGAVVEVFHETVSSSKTAPTVLNPINRKETETETFEDTLAKCFELGTNLTWEMMQGVGMPDIPLASLQLPLYMWDHDVSHWKESVVSEKQRYASDTISAGGELSVKNFGGPMRVSLETDLFLRDHIVNGEIVFPAAGYLVSIVRFAFVPGPASVIVLRNVRFESPMMMSTDRAAELVVQWPRYGGNNSRFEFLSGDRSKMFCSGTIDVQTHTRVALHEKDGNEPHFETEEGKNITKESVYSALEQRGLKYGPHFQRIIKARAAGGRCVGWMKGRPSGSRLSDIGLIDSCFQLCILNMPNDGNTYIPHGIKQFIHIHEPAADKNLTVEARALGHDNAGAYSFDIRVYEAGRLCAVVESFTVSQLGVSSKELIDDFFYETIYQPVVVAENIWDDAVAEAKEIPPPSPRSAQLDIVAANLIRNETNSVLGDSPSGAWSRYVAARNKSSANCGRLHTNMEGAEEVQAFVGIAKEALRNFLEKTPRFDYTTYVSTLLNSVRGVFSEKSFSVVKLGLLIPCSDEYLVEHFARELSSIHAVMAATPEVVLIFLDGPAPELSEEVIANFSKNSRFVEVTTGALSDISAFDIGSFHAVLSTNFHRCGDSRFVTQLVQDLLVPGGLFASVEVTDVHLPGMLATVAHPSWWNFESDRDQSWLNARELKAELGSGLFCDSVVTSSEDNEFYTTSFCLARKRHYSESRRRAYLVSVGGHEGRGGQDLSCYKTGLQKHDIDVVGLVEAADTNGFSQVVDMAAGEQAIVVLFPPNGFEDDTPAGIVWNFTQAFQLLLGPDGPGRCRAAVVLAGNHPNIDALLGLCRALHCERGARINVLRIQQSEILYREISIVLSDETYSCQPELDWKGDGWFEPKIVRSYAQARSPTSFSAMTSNHWHLEFPSDGSSTDDAYFGVLPRLPNLQNKNIRISVRAAGLNFKVAMILLGRLPGYNLENCCGEVAGIVEAVGPDAAECRFQPGDRVVAMVDSSGIGTTVDAHVSATQLIPEGITFEEAATIPVCFMTAYHGLVSKARLTKDETILIHSAAGGVGVAAVQIAKMCGANIIASVSSEKKRQFLHKEHGITEFVQSRSLDFEGEVMKITNGRGVDVVLNSLSGEALKAGIRCLAFDGRFVEIGKVDLLGDGRLPLAGFEQNLSFLSCHIDSLLAHKEKHGQVFHQVLQCFRTGKLKPMKHSTHAMSDVLSEVKRMMLGQHIGKIILKVPVNTSLPESLPTKSSLCRRFRPDGVYLITGGLGLVGLALAETMVQNGARSVVLVGRNPPRTFRQKQAISRMIAHGASIHAESIDVGDYDALNRLVERHNKPELRLRGVACVAGAIDDGNITTMTFERVQKVMRPKADGAWNLHRATKEHSIELDFFLCTGSQTSAVGNYSQSNYISANLYLAGLMRLRHQENLPASVIDLGPVLGEHGAGMIQDSSLVDALASQGSLAMTVEQSSAGHLEMMSPRNSQRHALFCLMDWMLNVSPPESVRRFSHLASGGIDSLGQQTTPIGLDEQKAIVRGMIAGELSKILQIPEDAVDPEKPIANYGLDSLGSMQLITFLKIKTKIMATQFDILGNATINSLAERIPREVVRLDSVSAQEKSVTTSNQKTEKKVRNPKQNPEKQAPTEPLPSPQSLSKTVNAAEPKYESVSPPVVPRDSNVILLTGATGCLGGQILEDLLRLNHSSTVICLVRLGSTDAASDKAARDVASQRFQTKLQENGHWPLAGWGSNRLRIVVGDVSKRRIGLSKEDLGYCLERITSVVHAAASVDFSLPLERHDAVNGKALVNLFEFVEEIAQKRNREVAFHHLSTTAVSSVPAINDPIQETFDIPFDKGMLGYGKSKWRQERYLLDKSKTCNAILIFVYRTPFALGHRRAQSSTAPTVMIQSAELLGALPLMPESLPVYPTNALGEAVALTVGSPPALVAQQLSDPTGKLQRSRIYLLHLTLPNRVSPREQRLELLSAGFQPASSAPIEIQAFLSRLDQLAIEDTGKRREFVDRLRLVLKLASSGLGENFIGFWETTHTVRALNTLAARHNSTAKSGGDHHSLCRIEDYGAIDTKETWKAFVASAQAQLHDALDGHHHPGKA